MKDEEPTGLLTPSHVSDTMPAWDGPCLASNTGKKKYIVFFSIYFNIIHF